MIVVEGLVFVVAIIVVVGFIPYVKATDIR